MEGGVQAVGVGQEVPLESTRASRKSPAWVVEVVVDQLKKKSFRLLTAAKAGQLTERTQSCAV